MEPSASLLPYKSGPGWMIGQNELVGGLGAPSTPGEIEIDKGSLFLIDYLAPHPLEEPIASCPIQDITASRQWFGATVRLDLGGEGRWYAKPPRGLKRGRRETQRLVDAITEAQRIRARRDT